MSFPFAVIDPADYASLDEFGAGLIYIKCGSDSATRKA
jgi:hypothetical protein